MFYDCIVVLVVTYICMNIFIFVSIYLYLWYIFMCDWLIHFFRFWKQWSVQTVKFWWLRYLKTSTCFRRFIYPSLPFCYRRLRSSSAWTRAWGSGTSTATTSTSSSGWRTLTTCTGLWWTRSKSCPRSHSGFP